MGVAVEVNKDVEMSARCAISKVPTLFVAIKLLFCVVPMILILPSTSTLAPGLVVPTPKLPLESRRIRSATVPELFV